MIDRSLATGVALMAVIAVGSGCSENAETVKSPIAPTAVSAPAAQPGNAQAGAPVIIEVREAEQGPPFYTPVFLGGAPPSGFLPTDGTWAGIYFYRDPSCIPGGFNLLQVFDVANAWNCHHTVTHTEWWHPEDMGLPGRFPFQVHTSGKGAVPIIFVQLSELAIATQDGVLTLSELAGQLSVLAGRAAFLEQIVHNSNQAANHGHETFVSRGRLDDGRSFEFRYNEKNLDGQHVFQNVKITFR